MNMTSGRHSILKNALAGEHRDFRHGGIAGGEGVALNRAAVELFEQSGQVVGDDFDDVEFERALGGDRGAVPHGLGGPLGVAAAFPGDRLDETDGEIRHLGLHGFIRFTSADGHRMGRADAGARRHRGHVRGQRDETPGAGGRGAGGLHVNNHRHR
jgi:hypothetical protein